MKNGDKYAEAKTGQGLKKIGRKFLWAFVLAPLLLSSVLPLAIASGEEGMKEVLFSQSGSDFLAKKKAEELYFKYAEALDPSYQPSREDLKVPADARYLSLGEGRQDFLAYYRFSGPGGECLTSGCDLVIFQREGKDEWRVVLDVTANRLWVGEAPQRGAPRDIFLQSGEGLAPLSDAGVRGQWRWENGSYQFLQEYMPGSP